MADPSDQEEPPLPPRVEIDLRPASGRSHPRPTTFQALRSCGIFVLAISGFAWLLGGKQAAISTLGFLGVGLLLSFIVPAVIWILARRSPPT